MLIWFEGIHIEPKGHNSEKPKSHTARNIAVTVLVVVIVVAGLIVVLKMRITPVSTPRIVNRILLNGTITINAASRWYLQFIIPSSAAQIQVSGSFEVSGGSFTEVRLYIADEANINHL